jgi:hypothetical protein
MLTAMPSTPASQSAAFGVSSMTLDDRMQTVGKQTIIAFEARDMASLSSRLTGSLGILFAAILSIGCSDGHLDSETKAAEVIEPTGRTEDTAHYCYRNEYPFEDEPDQKDIQSLSVDISGGRATGEYSWLPAFKDQRVGRFEGTVEGQSIVARYEYTQEGQSGVTTISIRLEPEQAVVAGGSPALGLNATIARVDCGVR